jgi:hypothetical protein
MGGAFCASRALTQAPPAVPPPGPARLRTDPDVNWVMERNGNFCALKAGCRYNFNYEQTFGRRRARSEFPERRIRAATLVDCP